LNQDKNNVKMNTPKEYDKFFEKQRDCKRVNGVKAEEPVKLGL
jgi:hypothetical protein